MNNMQQGGTYYKEVPEARTMKNSPFITNEQRNTQNQKQKEKSSYEQKPTIENPPLLDMKIYPQEQQASVPKTSYPVYMPMNPIQAPYYPYNMIPYMPPVINKYNISMPGTNGDHGMASSIIEDILPGRNFYHTANSLDERLMFLSYVRKILIKVSDGEDISLDPAAKHSLFHFIKLMDINPYSSNPFTDNPYKNLPRGMLLYRSAYPIRYDDATGQIIPAKNSVGLNIRIYRLSVAEYRPNLVNKQKHEFDTWREIKYYEYVRDDIIKQKMCPNFALMYAWYIDENCEVDFDQLDIIRNEHENIQNNNGSKGNNAPNCSSDIQNQFGGGSSSELQMIVEEGSELQLQIDQQTAEIYRDMNAYNKKAIIAITESPNQHIYSWGTRSYEVDGIRKIMVGSGYHDDEIWISIIFQIMAGMYAMQLKGIAIANFNFIDNVYIKDLFTSDYASKYWIYNIDGINYYIPNYGYLVMIDTNFKDCDDKNIHKIESIIFNDVMGPTGNKCFDMFKDTFTKDIFSVKFANEGFITPNEAVLNMLSNIQNSFKLPHKLGTGSNIDPFTDNEIISFYIHRHMQCFIHNRTGTMIKTDEKQYILDKDPSDIQFVRGNLIVYLLEPQEFKIAIYITEDQSTNTVTVICKNSPADIYYIIRTDIHKDRIRSFHDEQLILQTYKLNTSKFLMTDRLDYYTMDISMMCS